MEYLRQLLTGRTFSRAELVGALCKDDRAMRNIIRTARREGVPIVALPDGGYKLAETDDEKRRLLHLYRGRAMDELVTYNRLAASLQADGQLRIEEVGQ